MLMTRFEAEEILRNFPPLRDVSTVGTSNFLHHYGYQLQRLAWQGHVSAQQSVSNVLHPHGETINDVEGLGKTGVIGSSSKATAVPINTKSNNADELLNVTQGRGRQLSSTDDNLEYIVDAILSNDYDYEKVHGNTCTSMMDQLVEALITLETWRMKVVPHLIDAMKEPKNSDNKDVASKMGEAEKLSQAQRGTAEMRISFSLYVESTLLSILNLALNRRDGIEALGDEYALSLVDYCARRLTELSITPVEQNPMMKQQKYPQGKSIISSTPSSSMDEDEHKKMVEDLCRTLYQTQFLSCVTAVTTSRYLCEYLDSLPVGAQSRIMDTHDFLVLIIPLIEEPPWTRRVEKPVVTKRNTNKKSSDGVHKEKNTTNKMVWEKWIDHQWKEVEPKNLMELTQCEAMCWFVLWFLTCSNPTCRQQYGITTFRKEQFLRVRKYMTPLLLDQLPILVDMQRYMDQLALTKVPDSSSGYGSALLMQRVDTVRESIMKQSLQTYITNDCHKTESQSSQLIVEVKPQSSVSKSSNSPWKETAKHQLRHLATSMGENIEDLKQLSELYLMDDLEDLMTMNDDNIDDCSYSCEPNCIDEIEASSFLTQSIDKVDLRVIASPSHNTKTEEARHSWKCYLLPDNDHTPSVSLTDLGPFRRSKLVVPSRDFTTPGDGICRYGDKVEVIVSFQNSSKVVTLHGELTTLPKQEMKEETKRILDMDVMVTSPKGSKINTPEKKKNKTKSIWCQIGGLGLEEKIILQLGFVPVRQADNESKVVVMNANECERGSMQKGHRLKQAFLSQPA